MDKLNKQKKLRGFYQIMAILWPRLVFDIYIYPRGIRWLRPTNLRVIIIDFHTHLIGFILSQNHMVLGDSPIKYYI